LNQDRDSDNLTDEGTDGLDTPPNRATELVPDDVDEQETAPPYSSPLRGVEVLLRVSELNTQQMRQVSVVADFVTH
jgi:hypothetical protein